MNHTIDQRYSHLKLQQIPEIYKYALFSDQTQFLEAIKTVTQTAHSFPYSIFYTNEESSMIVPESLQLPSSKEEAGWSCFRIIGEMPFGSVPGLIATLSSALKTKGIGLCVVSTFQTDLFFVRQIYLEAAKATLLAEGWEFV